MYPWKKNKLCIFLNPNSENIPEMLIYDYVKKEESRMKISSEEGIIGDVLLVDPVKNCIVFLMYGM